MKSYLLNLSIAVFGIFAGALAGAALAAEPFNLITFAWAPALVQAGSAALLALLTGLAARFRGDPNTLSFRR